MLIGGHKLSAAATATWPSTFSEAPGPALGSFMASSSHLAAGTISVLTGPLGHVEVSMAMGVPKNGWFVVENPIVRVDDGMGDHHDLGNLKPTGTP